ncbi:NitT/TauT family transport system permease protein [Aromatoleum tolulyticum]|uniref:NitT/TauT family transport system permease protein n=1 Tax=Aromatoleum tolulyticum TaxID=34027 RepID=A0A1N6TJZ3_9RHOO|nr:NitT/TauT family transport system permease protein [Aromatoleum tolulyticum]
MSASALALSPAAASATAPAAPEIPRGGFLAGWWAGLRLDRIALRVLALILCVAFWQAAAVHHLDLGIVTFRFVPAPTEVAAAAWGLFQSPKLFAHVTNSLIRVFAGFGVAALLGIALGLVIGRSRWLEDTLLPPLEVMRPIPGVAWIPLAILMFPSSELSMIFITFMGALFPVLLNTIHGVEAIDRRLIASSRSLGAGRWSVFAEVVLPGALPSVVTGLAIGMGTSWFCLVTAEMIAGQYGIGYYTWESYTLQNYADIVVGMLFIGAFGMASSGLIKLLGRLLMPWYRIQERHA